jgi:hypothetical protein
MSDPIVDHAGQPAPPAPSTAAQRGGTSTGAAAAGVSAARERTLPGPSRRVLLEVRVAEGIQDVEAAAHAAVAGFSGFHAETTVPRAVTNRPESFAGAAAVRIVSPHRQRSSARLCRGRYKRTGSRRAISIAATRSGA